MNQTDNLTQFIFFTCTIRCRPVPGLETRSSICSQSDITMLGSSTDVAFLHDGPSIVKPTGPIHELEHVDWDNLKIVETQDEEGRIEVMNDDLVHASWFEGRG